jgi:hypothetical protein
MKRRFVYQSHVTVKRFAVEEDLSMNLVAHQLTARKNEKRRWKATDQNLIILKEVGLCR